MPYGHGEVGIILFIIYYLLFIIIIIICFVTCRIDRLKDT